MKKALKWGGLIVLGIVIVILLSGTALFVKGGSALEATFAVPVSKIQATTDSASVAHGARLANKLGCTDCHTGNLAGDVLIDAPPFLVSASNLTGGAGGVGSRYSDADFDRAIRQGVRPDGTPLIIMPSKAYHGLADDDVAAIIGYLRSIPPVDNELPVTKLKPLGRVLAAAGQFDVAMEVSDDLPMRSTAPRPDDMLEYGKYQAAICAYCHQQNFKGGVAMGPGAVPSDITPYGKLPVDQFIATLRTGVTPGGRELDTVAMPISIFAHWSEEEMTALHSYLGSL